MYLRLMEGMTREDILDSIESCNSKLKATQKRLSIPIVIRLCRKMRAGIKFPSIQVSDGVICNGHHRYVASALASVEIEIVPYDFKAEVINWKSIEFDDLDWDTEAEILEHNKKDAAYNNKTLDEILEILK
jgi:hypothetical protein